RWGERAIVSRSKTHQRQQPFTFKYPNAENLPLAIVLKTAPIRASRVQPSQSLLADRTAIHSKGGAARPPDSSSVWRPSVWMARSDPEPLERVKNRRGSLQVNVSDPGLLNHPDVPLIDSAQAVAQHTSLIGQLNVDRTEIVGRT